MIQKIVVFVSTFFLFFLMGGSVYASTLHLSPGSVQVGTGSVTPVQIRLNTAGESVNAFAAYLSYPSDKLEVAWVTYGGNFSIAAEGSYGGGSVRISRGNLSGVSGNVLVATVGFRGKTPGSGAVSFIGGSAAPRASDSSESMNLDGSTGTTFTVVQGSTTKTTTQTGSETKTVEKDTRKPTISSIKTDNITKENAMVSWITDENTDSMVEFGTDKEKYFLSVTNATLKRNHSLVIEDALLVPGTKIHFRVVAKDEAGNVTMSDDQILQLLGYSVHIKIVDQNNKPVKDRKVILYSDPIEAITDQNGNATFNNVTPGKHVAVVKGANTEKSVEIEVQESDKPQEFQATVANGLVLNASTLFVAIPIAVVLLVIGILLIMRRKRVRGPITNSTA